MFLLAGGTLLGLGFSIAMTVVAYIFFGPSGCHLNQTLISLNLVLGVAVAVISVHPEVQAVNPKSGLAQATIVIVYATYLICSALATEPVDLTQEPVCNLLAKSGGFKTSTIIVGAMLTFISIAYSTTRAASNRLMLDDAADGQGSRAALYAAVESGALPASALDEDDEDDEKEGPSSGDDEKNGAAYSYSFFHTTFALAGMYVAMLVTNVGVCFRFCSSFLWKRLTPCRNSRPIVEHRLFFRGFDDGWNRLGQRLGPNGYQLDRALALHVDVAWTGGVARQGVFLKRTGKQWIGDSIARFLRI